MAKSKALITLIREIVRAEVKKEINKIFIKEGVKAVSRKVTEVPEVLSKPIPKKLKPKEVSYTKDPTLNKILNETAQSQEFDEYPSMGEYDTSNMAELLGYGGTSAGSDEAKREVAAVQTAQAVGADTSNKAVQDVMSNLTKDYRGVMKALDKKDGK
jgi:hypothetical protein